VEEYTSRNKDATTEIAMSPASSAQVDDMKGVNPSTGPDPEMFYKSCSTSEVSPDVKIHACVAFPSLRAASLAPNNTLPVCSIFCMRASPLSGGNLTFPQIWRKLSGRLLNSSDMGFKYDCVEETSILCGIFPMTLYPFLIKVTSTG
jgi:hypothetical protein